MKDLTQRLEALQADYRKSGVEMSATFEDIKMTFMKITKTKNVLKTRFPYSEGLIDLSERPNPVRMGSYAPMMLYNFETGRYGTAIAGGDGWLFDQPSFEPTHAAFLPFIDYRKDFSK